MALLDAALTEQVRAYLQHVREPVELVCSLDGDSDGGSGPDDAGARMRSLLEEVAAEAFGAHVAHSRLAAFMLGAYPLHPAWYDRFAGVLHADGSLRPQIVRADDPDQRFLHAVLTCLWERHGVSGLINTSFNGPGEPIVQRPEDALDCGRRLGLDGVVIHGSLHRP